MSNNRDGKEEYLSKSRLKTWVKCPRKFYYSYVKNIEVEETQSMVRGTKIHDLIEGFYNNAEEYAKDNDSPPTTMFSLIDSDIHSDWREFLDPYIAHFLGFERRRWENAGCMEDWLPIGVEEGMWEDVFEDTPVLTGYADALLPAASFGDSDVPQNTGCVLVDFKTGEAKSSKYRSQENAGVLLDLAYYKILFECDYDIKAVAGYYPKSDKLVVSDVDEEKREFIRRVSKEITEADEENIEDYPLKRSPLCAWGQEESERCEFYENCKSKWAEPIDNEDETVEMLKQGMSNEDIADKLDTTEEAVSYWIRKKRLHRYRD